MFLAGCAHFILANITPVAIAAVAAAGNAYFIPADLAATAAVIIPASEQAPAPLADVSVSAFTVFSTADTITVFTYAGRAIAVCNAAATGITNTFNA